MRMQRRHDNEYLDEPREWRKDDDDDEEDDTSRQCHSSTRGGFTERRTTSSPVVIVDWDHESTTGQPRSMDRRRRRPRSIDRRRRHTNSVLGVHHYQQQQQQQQHPLLMRPVVVVGTMVLLLVRLNLGIQRPCHVCAWIPPGRHVTPNSVTVPRTTTTRRSVRSAWSLSSSSSSSFLDSDPSDTRVEVWNDMLAATGSPSPRLDPLSLIVQPSTNNTYSSSNNNNNNTTTNNTTPFLLHDLNRVLDSRRDAIRNDPVLSRGRMERRTKPPLMVHDIDGAERCLVLVRHYYHQHHHHTHTNWQQQQRRNATDDSSASDPPPPMTLAEAAYQIVMRAFLQRGRLRWHTATSTWTAPTSATSASPPLSTPSTPTTPMDTTIICAADQLEQLLAELQSILSSSSVYGTGAGVSLETYNLVLAAYAVCATPRGDRHYAERAHALLLDTVRDDDNNNNNNNYRATVTASRFSQADTDKDDETNTNSLTVASSSPSSSSCTPLVESHLHVLHAFAWQQANLQPATTGADPAFALLETICSLERDNTEILLQAHIWVLEAYSKSIGGARRCQQLLETVKELNATTATAGTNTPSTNHHHHHRRHGRPLLDAEVYSNAILAWSKATDDVGNDDASSTSASPAEMAHALLLELIDLYMAGAFRHQSDTDTDISSSSTHEEGGIVGSEPPLIAFNGVISAWGRVGRLDKAEEVLWLMEKKLRPQCRNLVPNAVSYNSVLHGILRLLDRETALCKGLDLVAYMELHANEQPAIQPNAFTYQTLMKCWLQSQRPNAAEEAELLLLRIEQLWSAGDESIEPTNRIYNMVLNAYAKKSSGRFVSDKALDIIRRMKRSSKCQPDIISFTSAIECISNSGDVKAPELAEGLFLEATTRYNETKQPESLPNLRFYTMTIQALAKNNGSVVRARALLTQLVEQYHASGRNPQLRPNTYPYNYVLNCAANTLDTDKMEAFRIASQTYQEMRKSDLVRPDSYSFAFWLKCCNNLLEPGDLRTKGISFAFEECKREGLVNNEVITRLVQGSPLSLVDQLLETTPTETVDNRFDKTSKPILAPRGTGLLNKGLSIRATPANNNNNNSRSLTVRDLPPSWSRNTRER